MSTKHEITVRLFVRGPFMTSSGTDAVRGIDRIFSQDHTGQPILNSSHIKGKVREAIVELCETGLTEFNDFSIDFYFGIEDQERGHLQFGDFELVQCEKSKLDYITRISIETKTGAAKESNLQIIENIFAQNAISEWRGTVSFYAENEAERQNILQALQLGFKWITALGGIKGSGFGRLERVQFSDQEVQRKSLADNLPAKPESIALAFEFDDDLFIGGITRGSNFKESMRIIPGATIKGSLARHLNAMCDESDWSTPIDLQNRRVAAQFPVLAEHFSKIVFTHALPAPPDSQKRPVTVPFTTLELEKGKFGDVALVREPVLTSAGNAPLFQIDWKDAHVLDSAFGWGRCEIFNKTRTAIHRLSQTAAENRLYTFQYISPFEATNAENGTRKKLRWLAEIRLPKGPAGHLLDDATRDSLVEELKRALNYQWNVLGKRDSHFRLAAQPGPWECAISQHAQGEIVNGTAIVTLQTDALLFDGRALAGQAQIDLHRVYAEYWQHATQSTCTLEDFFARQKMLGGYQAMRFPTGNSYYPYILTEAGSVFILKVSEEAKARKILQCLQWNGLPLPKSILRKTSQPQEAWRYCPFVPENGFGEVMINLDWHWQKQYPAMKGDEK